MIAATLIVKLSEGFVGGCELELLLVAIRISLLFPGPERISIEWDVLKRKYFQEERLSFSSKRKAYQTNMSKVEHQKTVQMTGD